MPLSLPFPLTAQSIAGLLIVLTTLLLIVTRPPRVTEAPAAVLGGLLTILVGLVTPAEAVAVLLSQWNVFLFFLGLMLIAVLTEAAGFFDRTARWAVRSSGGSPRRLLVNLFLIGTAITAVLSNDATALVLTPVIYLLVVRLRLQPTPFVFACPFVADAASFILPVSNPVNVILLEPFEVGLGQFLGHLLAPAAVVLVLNLALFLVVFRHALAGRVDAVRLDEAAPPVHEPLLRTVYTLLGLIALGYVAASALRWPLSMVALAGAAALLAATALHGRLDPRRTLGGIAWSIFPFIAGMLVVVRGVENLGLTAAFAALLVQLSGGTALGAALVGVGGVALGANLINNVPMALVMASAIGTLPAAAGREPLLFASILGAALGPNVSVTGSLATMLWLLILRRRGLEVSSLDYLKLGAIITVPALLAGALTLWWTFQIGN